VVIFLQLNHYYTCSWKNLQRKTANYFGTDFSFKEETLKIIFLAYLQIPFPWEISALQIFFVLLKVGPSHGIYWYVIGRQVGMKLRIIFI
jgi:hypothetical protein